MMNQEQADLTRPVVGDNKIPIDLLINYFKFVTDDVPNAELYEYTVNISTEDGIDVGGSTDMGRKLFDQTYGEVPEGKMFAYDGEKTLYMVDSLPNDKIQFNVVLHEESPADRDTIFTVRLSYATKIPLKWIALAIEGKEVDSNAQDALRVLDILKNCNYFHVPIIGYDCGQQHLYSADLPYLDPNYLDPSDAVINYGYDEDPVLPQVVGCEQPVSIVFSHAHVSTTLILDPDSTEWPEVEQKLKTLWIKAKHRNMEFKIKDQNEPKHVHNYFCDSGVLALAQDLIHFEITSEVPEGLSKYVVSKKKSQARWYATLSEAWWRQAIPPPKTLDEAARLVIKNLKKYLKADVEGLLAFYGLPLPDTLVQASQDCDEELTWECDLLSLDPYLPDTLAQDSSGVSTIWPQGVKYEMQTLPVYASSIPDGDTITVLVDTADPRESFRVPTDVQLAFLQRSQARAEGNDAEAYTLHQQIIESGYRVIAVDNNEEVLARKYRIRLRGIDAPESEMPYGKKAKKELVRLVEGKCLRILVYGEDRYGRCVADIYCDGIFIQEVLLKKGLAWHYVDYDQRLELAIWEEEARAKRVGLWASKNPEKPWDWRKQKRIEKEIQLLLNKYNTKFTKERNI